MKKQMSMEIFVFSWKYTPEMSTEIAYYTQLFLEITSSKGVCGHCS